MGKIAQLKADPEFHKLLLAGNAEALNEVRRLERIIKTPAGTFYGGQQTPAEVEQHQEVWRGRLPRGRARAMGFATVRRSPGQMGLDALRSLPGIICCDLRARFGCREA
jgi:hypothetical protein